MCKSCVTYLLSYLKWGSGYGSKSRLKPHCLQVTGLVWSIVYNSTKLGGLKHKELQLSPSKTAIVTLILKKPTMDSLDPASYRPVSNLTFVSKLVEKIANVRLSEFADQHIVGGELYSRVQLSDDYMSSISFSSEKGVEYDYRW